MLEHSSFPSVLRGKPIQGEKREKPAPGATLAGRFPKSRLNFPSQISPNSLKLGLISRTRSPLVGISGICEDPGIYSWSWLGDFSPPGPASPESKEMRDPVIIPWISGNSMRLLASGIPFPPKSRTINPFFHSNCGCGFSKAISPSAGGKATPKMLELLWAGIFHLFFSLSDFQIPLEQGKHQDQGWEFLPSSGIGMSFMGRMIPGNSRNGFPDPRDGFPAFHPHPDNSKPSYSQRINQFFFQWNIPFLKPTRHFHKFF